MAKRVILFLGPIALALWAYWLSNRPRVLTPVRTLQEKGGIIFL